MNIGISIEPAVTGNQDRAAAYAVESGAVLVLADGAGGIAGGGAAAEHLLSFVKARAESLAAAGDGEAVASMLRGADLSVQAAAGCGETTAVVAVVVNGAVFGASVGDSEAWIVDGAQALVLTADQRRRPFIGTGEVEPVAFGPVRPGGWRLLLGSDGLFKYMKRRRILETLAAGEDAGILARALTRAAQLPSGRYPDDVSVIVCCGA